MFRDINSIVLEGSYQHNTLRVAQRCDGTLLVTWAEISEGRYWAPKFGLRNPDDTWIFYDLGRALPIVAASPLGNGKIGLVRSRRFVFEAAVFEDDFQSMEFLPVGRCDAGGELDLLPIGNGAMGLNSRNMLFAHIPDGPCSFIVAVEPESWVSAATVLADGRIVRVDSGGHDHYQQTPQYTITGKLFDQQIRAVGDFSLQLPSKVIVDTYAHPSRLKIAPLPESDFVMVWALNEGSLGNLVEWQRFDEAGKPKGPIQLALKADCNSHISLIDCIALDETSVVLTYTERRETESTVVALRVDLNTGVSFKVHDERWSSDWTDMQISHAQSGRIFGVEAAEGQIRVMQFDAN